MENVIAKLILKVAKLNMVLWNDNDYYHIDVFNGKTALSQSTRTNLKDAKIRFLYLAEQFIGTE